MNKRFYRIIFLIIGGLCLLPACGREEYKAEAGVDGYVYVPGKLRMTVQPYELKVMENYLYYICRKENTGERVIERADVSSLVSGGDFDSSCRETVLESFTRYGPLPDYAGEVLTKSGYEGKLLEEKKYSFYVQDFAVDPGMNFYYYEHIYGNPDSGPELLGGILYRKSGKGEIDYQVYSREIDGLAVDGEGKAYILTGNQILVFDSRGKQAGNSSIEEFKAGKNIRSEELFGDSEGNVYYSVVYSDMTRRTLEVAENGGGSFRLQDAGNFLGKGIARHYPAMEGNMFLDTVNTDQVLYEYRRESGHTAVLLNWVESGMLNYYVSSIVQISSDRLLVSYSEPSRKGLYLLTRTPTEELPERKELVLASVKPSAGLQRAVVNFNLENEEYRILIDDYDSWYSREEGRWVTVRLDAALASSSPPDLIDMMQLDISVYAEKGVPEDLYPYLDGSSALSREDFLENMLDGLTVNGRLVCIPLRFEIDCVAGRASQIDVLESWTAEDIYELSEAYPDSAVIYDYAGEGKRREYLTEIFWPFYCLERFVNREERKCSFDSGEFCRLLDWTAEHGREPEASGRVMEDTYSTGYVRPGEETLLLSAPYLDFMFPSVLEILWGEPVRLKGFPSAEGNGYFRADILDAVGIVSGSADTAGAWEFLEYYLTMEQGAFDTGLSTKTALLQEAFQEAVTEEYTKTVDGMPDRESPRKSKLQLSVDGESIPCYAARPDQAEEVMSAILAADFTPLSGEEREIISIISEESEYCFNGTRSSEEAAAIIQNRVSLLLEERGR